MSASWRRAGLALALGIVGFGIVFAHEAEAAYGVWWASTAYNHCFLILPIALYLLWERRAGFAALEPAAEPRAALLAVPFALAWFVAQRLGIMEGRQLAAMGILQCLLLGVLGRSVYWHFRAPFWYLVFLVPFGSFLVAPLQRFTAEFAAAGLSLLGIAHYLHGTTIEIAAGAFRIARACAGLRFLIAAIAFAVLYALVIFRSTGRRLAFIAVCLVVPVIANGFRALGIIWLGYAEGSAKAAATDHVLYGYIFFSIVLFVIILLGLPFREDHALPAVVPGAPAPAARGTSLVAALAVLAVSLAGPAVAFALDRQARQTVVVPPARLAGWRAVPTPSGGLPAGAIRRDFVDPDGFRATIVAFPPGTAPEPIFDLRRRLGLFNLREVHLGLIRATGSGAPNWQLAVSKNGHRMAASDLVIDGRLTLGSLVTRLYMLDDLFVARDAQLVVVVTAPRGGLPTVAALRHVLASPALTPPALRKIARAAANR